MQSIKEASLSKVPLNKEEKLYQDFDEYKEQKNIKKP